jgi:hypothetical protein
MSIYSEIVVGMGPQPSDESADSAHSASVDPGYRCGCLQVVVGIGPQPADELVVSAPSSGSLLGAAEYWCGCENGEKAPVASEGDLFQLAGVAQPNIMSTQRLCTLSPDRKIPLMDSSNS